MLDGLKPGQRKILFGCFKRNLTKDIKVSAAIVTQSLSCIVENANAGIQLAIRHVDLYVAANCRECLSYSGCIDRPMHNPSC